MPVLAASAAAFLVAFRHGGERLAHGEGICQGVTMRVVFCLAICYSRGRLSAAVQLGNGSKRPKAVIAKAVDLVVTKDFGLMPEVYCVTFWNNG